MMKRQATTWAVSAALVLGGLTTTAVGVAEARPAPAPQSWPGCPPDNPAGPCRWCPDDPPVQTGNLRVNPVVWDQSVCHTYWYVLPGQGNVANNISEGAVPPPPPPSPPALITTYEDCVQKLGPLSLFCPKG